MYFRRFIIYSIHEIICKDTNKHLSLVPYRTLHKNMYFPETHEGIQIEKLNRAQICEKSR